MPVDCLVRQAGGSSSPSLGFPLPAPRVASHVRRGGRDSSVAPTRFLACVPVVGFYVVHRTRFPLPAPRVASHVRRGGRDSSAAPTRFLARVPVVGFYVVHRTAAMSAGDGRRRRRPPRRRRQRRRRQQHCSRPLGSWHRRRRGRSSRCRGRGLGKCPRRGHRLCLRRRRCSRRRRQRGGRRDADHAQGHCARQRRKARPQVPDAVGADVVVPQVEIKGSEARQPRHCARQVCHPSVLDTVGVQV
mmetsp:Transcript_1905/g.4497  ORF Transcript_1905/g.4497 Transcript_1905/m.4497 type:complete len:245 (+) Transcript_1905:970-1704(+)